MTDDYEYDPAYIEAKAQTFEAQTERLNHAIRDVGNEIAKGVLPHLISFSSMMRGWWSELHADEYAAWPWYRRWWHTMTGHRS